MRVPSQEYALAGGLKCLPREVPLGAWLDHVVKHALGVRSIARSEGRDPWHHEGWDRLDPPVVNDADRTTLAAAIGALTEGKLRCEVPELRGKKRGSAPDRLACYECQEPILGRCAKLVATSGVGDRYRATLEDLLRELSVDGGVQVGRAAFHTAARRFYRTPERIDGVVLLSLGVDDRRSRTPIVRISRSDGVRAEFYLDTPQRMRWRTTYRDALATSAGEGRITFVSDMPFCPSYLSAVSEHCVVARRWWDSHGI
jgi:hypothetical protein